MHEFAIAHSIRDIVNENISPLLETKTIIVKSVTVRHGVLSQVVPDILVEAFKAVTLEDKALQNAELELIEVPALLECCACHKSFSPKNKDEIFMPCPHCQSIASHTLLEGKELVVDHIEAVEESL